jgi:hypothetical protein
MRTTSSNKLPPASSCARCPHPALPHNCATS